MVETARLVGKHWSSKEEEEDDDEEKERRNVKAGGEEAKTDAVKLSFVSTATDSGVRPRSSKDCADPLPQVRRAQSSIIQNMTNTMMARADSSERRGAAFTFDAEYSGDSASTLADGDSNDPVTADASIR